MNALNVSSPEENHFNLTKKPKQLIELSKMGSQLQMFG